MRVEFTLDCVGGQTLALTIFDSQISTAVLSGVATLN